MTDKPDGGLGLLEQDIACGIDKMGSSVKNESVQRRVFSELESAMPSEWKLRLLMLYFVSFANIPTSVRDKFIAQAGLAPEESAILRAMMVTELMNVPESQCKNTGSGMKHRVTSDQAQRFKRRATSGEFPLLSRFEPRINTLVEQLLGNKISNEDFPLLRLEGDRFGAQTAEGLRGGAVGIAPPGAPVLSNTDDWSFAPAPRSYGAADSNPFSPPEVSQRIIVFVIGGITLSELRVVDDLAKTFPRGIELLVGGTAILTPKRLMRVLRPTPSSVAEAAMQDPFDLT